MTKTVLFVTYGGGHARMVIPVIRALERDADIRIETLVLTTGGPIFASENLPYRSFKDFITEADSEALAWGKTLAAQFHSPESGIEEAESVAYLGLSYWDLVLRHGEAAAAKLWADKGRHAFLPLSVLERVIERIRPDMVVTTNSPKAEQAAIEVANRRGIHTLSMIDLFGIHHFHAVEAETITVLCQHTIANMRQEGVNKPDDAFLVTGNPAFDRACEYQGSIDYSYRKTYFPQLPADKPILLWIDMPAYWKERVLHIRSDEEIIRDLESLSQAAKLNGGSMLVRPHPSQQRGIYDEWLKSQSPESVAYAGGVPLYPLLKAVDVVATYTSTVSVEALLMRRKVIQLKYQPGRSDMPLGEWQVAWQAQDPAELPVLVRAAFYDEEEWQRMQQRMASLFPQGRAADVIAGHIRRILAN